jgi:predicted CopG family antitoxin
MTMTVRISDRAHATLRDLAQRRDESMAQVLERLIEDERRSRLLEDANEAYAALRAEPQAWAAVIEERAAWDATLADGLADWPAD